MKSKAVYIVAALILVALNGASLWADETSGLLHSIPCILALSWTISTSPRRRPGNTSDRRRP